MKIIKVTIEDFVIESGGTAPVKKVFPIEIPYTDESMKWAKEHSVGGKIEIIEREDPVSAPSQLDIIEAQVFYTAMITDTLLEV